MKSWKNSLTVLSLAIGMLPAAALADGDCDDQVALVRLLPGAGIAAFNQRNGSSTLASIVSRDIYLVAVPPGTSYSDFVETAGDDPALLSLEENCLVTDTSPEGGTRSFFFSTAPGAYLDQAAVGILDINGAQVTSLGGGVTVAIIDTGVSPHTLVAPSIIPGGFDFVLNSSNTAETGDGLDNDGDGFTDEMIGHGTFIAGLVLRVAPAADILPVRVMDDEGISSTFLLTAGVYHAIDQGADVLNISMGATLPSTVLSDAIAAAHAAGMHVVSSVGNEGNESPIRYPSGDSGVLAVGATSNLDIRADFSNYGLHLSLCAPGEALSSVDTASGFVAADGTSFAAPLVAGTLALLRSADPGASRETVTSALLDNTRFLDILNPSYAGKLGAGRLDSGAALADGRLCLGDVTLNRTIDLSDLGVVLANFGLASGATFAQGDLNTDGVIDLSDLGVVLASFGRQCE